MLRRLIVGLLKGLVVGVGLGLAFQLGLGWSTTGELLAYLLAMGTGATAGVLCGRAPWRQDSWLETLLKIVAGVGVGALVYWMTHTYVRIGLPVAVLGAPEGTPWTAVPILYLPLPALVFGALVELDNTPDAPTPTPRTAAPAEPPDAASDWDR